MTRPGGYIPGILLAIGVGLAIANTESRAGGDAGRIAFTHRGTDPALTVGEHGFSRQGIALRRAQIRWKYPGYPEDEANVAAHAQLIIGYLLVEVLAASGHPISEPDLQAELRRIDRNTKRPRQLEALKAIYQDQPDKYGAIGILPDFANRRYFFEVFPALERVQAPVKARAERMRQRIEQRAPADLARLAASHDGWQYRRLLFHPERGFFRAPPDTNAPDERSAIQERLEKWSRTKAEGERARLFGRLEEAIFAGLGKGGIASHVVEFDRDFSIFRSLGWRNGRQRVRLVERLSLPKITPHEYLWKMAATVPAWIADGEMRRRLTENRPELGRLAWHD